MVYITDPKVVNKRLFKKNQQLETQISSLATRLQEAEAERDGFKEILRQVICEWCYDNELDVQIFIKQALKNLKKFKEIS